MYVTSPWKPRLGAAVKEIDPGAVGVQDDVTDPGLHVDGRTHQI
ncbi:hypothetical protein [Streptomyces mirabilis]